jgi:O-antigen/teichoic acid export membrane protein
MMSDRTALGKRMTRNTGYAFLGNLFYRMVNFAVVLTLARYLGKDLFGTYGFVFAYITVFDIFIEFGFVRILVREMTKKTYDPGLLIGNAIFLRLGIILLSLFGAIIGVAVLGYTPEIKVLIFIASFSLFSQVRSLFEVIFMVKLKMQYPAIESVIRSVSYAVLICVALYGNLTLRQIIIFNVASGFIGLSFLIPVSWKHLRPRFSFNYPIALFLIRQSSPLMFSSVFLILYDNIDILMLSKMRAFVDIGYYTAATRLVESLAIFPATILISVFPVISDSFHSDRETFQRLCQKILVFFLAIALPMSVLTSLYSSQIISFLYGKEFLPACSALRIVVWSSCFIFTMYLTTHILIVAQKQYIDTLGSLLMFVTNVLLNLYLIPRFGFVGAAVAMLISRISGSLYGWKYVFQYARFRLPVFKITQITVANIGLFLLGIFLLRCCEGYWLLAVLFSGALYFLVLRKIGISPFNHSLSL